MSLAQDAEDNGPGCRRNYRSYPAVESSGFGRLDPRSKQLDDPIRIVDTASPSPTAGALHRSPQSGVGRKPRIGCKTRMGFSLGEYLAASLG